MEAMNSAGWQALTGKAVEEMVLGHRLAYSWHRATAGRGHGSGLGMGTHM
jgi:hypothetical protein